APGCSAATARSERWTSASPAGAARPFWLPATTASTPHASIGNGSPAIALIPSTRKSDPDARLVVDQADRFDVALRELGVDRIDRYGLAPGRGERGHVVRVPVRERVRPVPEVPVRQDERASLLGDEAGVDRLEAGRAAARDNHLVALRAEQDGEELADLGD